MRVHALDRFAEHDYELGIWNVFFDHGWGIVTVYISTLLSQKYQFYFFIIIACVILYYIVLYLIMFCLVLFRYPAVASKEMRKREESVHGNWLQYQSGGNL